jgi:hypothetical protein
MPNKCFSLVRGRSMRVTRLDGCGEVVLGPDSSVVSDGFITVGLTAQTDEGTTISVTNAAGDICILDEPCPKFTGYEVGIEFCGVNPALYEILTGQQPVLDGSATPTAIGFRMNTGVDACDSGFALEVWSQVPTAVCEPGAGVNYGYFLIPFVRGGIIGDFTIGNDAVNFTLSGAKSKDGSAWGVGPYDVVKDDTNIDAPLLDAIDPKDHLHVQLTTVPPPEPDCDYVEVGTAATGATAGSPGSFTPANSYGPEDLAALQASAVTASPATAWTSGQYVTLGDGSLASWSGTAWEAGAA